MLDVSIKRNRLFISGNISEIESFNIIGWKQDASRNTASCNLDIEAIDSLLQQDECKATEEVKLWYKKENNKRKIVKKAHGKFKLDMTNLNEEMKEYQRKAVNFFDKTKSCIIAYSPGLGKSLIALNCIKKIKATKVLLVCPSYLKYNFAHEVKKWSNLSYTIIEGTPSKRDKQFEEFEKNNKNILIINYEQIRIKMKKGKLDSINVHKYIQKTKFDLVIWDEAHRLKTRDSQVSLGAFALNTDYRLMLTGTPITKNPGEIFSLLKILDRDRFKSYWTFVDFYCNVEENNFRGKDIKGLKRPKQFKKLINQYMIRETKESVAPDLPDKIFIEIPVKMYPKQEKYYKDAMDFYLKPDDDVIESDVERFIRLCQINQNPVILDGEDISVSRDTTISLIEDIEPQRIMVACTYIGMSDNLAKSIKESFKNRNVYLINSKVKKREEVVEKFKNDSTGILVTTIKCLAEGANLDCCDYMIMNDIEWNCGVNDQFFNRIHRMTSTRKKTYYFVIIEDTVHEYKHQKIYSESQMVKTSLGDSDQNIIKSVMKGFKP